MIDRRHWIPGNQAAPLDAGTPPAMVLSGSAVVFAVDKKSGSRRALFCVEPGEPLMPLPYPSEATWTIVAVPLESSGIELGRDTAQWGDIVALENWLAKIGEAFAAFRETGPVRLIQPPQRMSLPKGERAAIAEGLTFVRIGTGGAVFAGKPRSEGDVVALVPGLWLESAGNSEWVALDSPPENAQEVLTATVESVVPCLIEVVDEAERRRDQSDRQRFADRRQWNSRIAAAALEELASVAAPRQPLTAPWPESGSLPGDRLLAAVRAAAEVVGVAVRPAPGPYYGSDPFLEIANASGLRTRSVLLRGRWWRAQNGPLVAFREDGSPVAILPSCTGFFGRARCQMFDPATGSRLPLDSQSAPRLRPFAFMLYRPLPGDLSTAALLRHALVGAGRDLRTIAVAGIGAALLAFAVPAGTAVLIGQAIPDGDPGLVWQVAAGMVAAAFGSMLFLLTQAVATLRVTTAAFAVLQTGLWDYLLNLSPAWFRGYTAGQLRMRADAVTRIQHLLTADVLRSWFAAAASVPLLLLIFWYSAGLGWIALAGGGAVVLGAWFGVRALSRAQERSQDVEEELSGLVLQAVQAVSKLRVAGAAGRAFSHWAIAYSRKQRIAFSLQRIRDRIHLLNLLAPMAASALGFLYLLDHPMPLGAFLAANAALTALLAAVVSGSDNCAGLAVVASLWRRSRTVLAAKPEVDGSRSQPGVLRGAIAAENLTFRYRADGPLILDNVSVRAAPGECIAITGPSGSGKSTLLNLILRFEAPLSGAVYMDGRELSSLDITAVRRRIGVVTQDARILAGSVFENICCGGVRGMEEAWEAARAAGLAEDIEDMPMGMHTVVSEGGGNLSGGQRQRLLIARALVLKPSILIFDEATSSLDNRTQAVVAENVRRLKATRILVAHRLSTIRSADRIYVLDKGRIVQQGTFSELASQPGLFARLVARQTA